MKLDQARGEDLNTMNKDMKQQGSKLLLVFQKTQHTPTDGVTHVKLVRVGLVHNMFQLVNKQSIFLNVKISKLH